jgi:hypothetical protein
MEFLPWWTHWKKSTMVQMDLLHAGVFLSRIKLVILLHIQQIFSYINFVIDERYQLTIYLYIIIIVLYIIIILVKHLKSFRCVVIIKLMQLSLLF